MKRVFFLCTILVLLSGISVSAAELHVPGDYTTIQAAIDAAQSGDVVLVADGLYSGNGNVNIELQGKQITVQSVNGPENCIIECDYSARAFYIHQNETNSTVISGFTIQNGYSTIYGGGFHIESSPRIANCRILNCVAESSGGAVYCIGNSITPRLEDTVISNNTADISGGGVSCVTQRSAMADGQRATGPVLVMESCQLLANETEGDGGAVYLDNAECIAINCVVASNRSNDLGGGVATENAAESQWTACMFIGNYSEDNGGGLHIGSVSTCYVDNSILAGNQASDSGGACLTDVESSSTFTNCTVSGNDANTAGGFYISPDTHVYLRNTILHQNSYNAVVEGSETAVAHLDNNLISDNPDGIFYDYDLGQIDSVIDLNLQIPEASNNIQGEILFDHFVGGVWTDDPVYDSVTNTTRFTNASAAYIENELVDGILNPNSNQTRLGFIVSNTATTIDIAGNYAPSAISGDEYILMDFHLQDGSAGLDRANLNMAPDGDIDGDPRPGDDSLADIGADEAPHEYLPPEDTTAPESQVVNLPEVVFSEIFNVEFIAGDGESTIDYVELYYQYESGTWEYYGTVNSGNVFSFNTSQASGDGNYGFYTIAADLSGNIEAAPAEADAVTLVNSSFTGDRIYVDIEAVGLGTGEDWDNAMTSLEMALQAAVEYEVEEIWVGDGLYETSIELTSNLHLYGGFDGTETGLNDRAIDENPSIIDGSQVNQGAPAHHVVTIRSKTQVTLDGFVITGGNADTSGSNECGGGLYIIDVDDTVSIANCRVTGNYAHQFGGGIFAADSEVKMSNCVVYNNEANQRGGGIFMSDNDISNLTRKGPERVARRATSPGPILNGCTIAGNSAMEGAGVCNDYIGSTITDSLVAGNIASDDGGGLQYTSNLTLSRRSPTKADPPATDYTPMLINTVVASNRADSGAGIHVESDALNTRFCLVYRNWSNYDMGGGLYVNNDLSMINTIITENQGTGVYQYDNSFNTEVLSCLFHDNGPDDYYRYSTYTSCTGANEINMNISGASDNHSGDPLLDTYLEGLWTADPTYLSDENLTILTDDTAVWVPGQLRWKMIEVLTDSYRDYLIVDNTATTITVSGDATQWAGNNDPYRIPDYHLQNGSAAIDRANPDQGIFWDCDMDPRPGNDGMYDIGVDETTDAWLPPEDTIDPISLVEELPVHMGLAAFDIQFMASDAESGLDYVELYYRHEGDSWTQYGSTFTQSPIYFDTAQAAGQGYYEFAMVATDNAGNTEAFPAEFNTCSWIVYTHPGSRILVNINGTEPQTSSSWNAGFHSLKPITAIASYFNVYDVWVAQGQYTTEFQFISHLKLYGGFNGTETSLDQRVLGQYPSVLDGSDAQGIGEDAYHVVTLNNVQFCLLDGFTVTGGNARGSTDYGRGGGIYAQNLDDTSTIMNCEITENSAHRGAGLYGLRAYTHIQNCRMILNNADEKGGGAYLAGDTREDAQRLVNCVFGGNTADDGAGIYLTIAEGDNLAGSQRSATNRTARATGTVANLKNCMITENVANDYGGGVLIDAAAEIDNCTIADNYSTSGGGIFASYEGYVSNSIIWGNSPDSIISNNSNEPIVTYSDVAGGYSGQGNINSDPLFINGPFGGYYLSHTGAGQTDTSPCIDAGLNDAEDVCMDTRYGLVCMNTLTNRTDEVVDTGICNMGFHHHPENYMPPTPSPVPTRTVTPTPPPYMSPTPKPSNTPMNTYTPSPTPTFTPTRAPTYTPTPQPPTATPECKDLGVSIEMPSDNLVTGMECYCNAIVCNTTDNPLVNHPLFVLLDVYGMIFFAPSFSEEFDNYLNTWPEFQPGRTTVTVLPPFEWPEVDGSASDIMWYAALTNPEMTDIVGQSGAFKFGWNN